MKGRASLGSSCGPVMSVDADVLLDEGQHGKEREMGIRGQIFGGPGAAASRWEMIGSGKLWGFTQLAGTEEELLLPQEHWGLRV